MMKPKEKVVVITAILLMVILPFAVCSWTFMIFVGPFTIYGASDPFYRYGDNLFDVDLNFPLLKPYYATALPKGFPHYKDLSQYIWSVNLKGGSKVRRRSNICCDIKIAVENDILFVYAPDPTADLDGVTYYWFVLKPKSHEELGFEDQIKFEEYLNSHHINEPKWREPRDLHDEFNLTGCLDWYPNCTKIPPIFRFPPSLFEKY